MIDKQLPLVLVPCFSGAPWDTSAFPSWRGRKLITGRLPNAVDLDAYADVVAGWTRHLGEYVLVGDSFGALVALALAERRPHGLRALVISGGFAKAHVSGWTRVRMATGRLLGRAGYPLTVRFHVDSLGSPFDPRGTDALLRRIFMEDCDAPTFFDRGRIALAADLRPELKRVDAPTLVLTPEHDRLIGREAAAELATGIPHAREEVLAGTGHLLRFTHPRRYAEAIDGFVSHALHERPAA
ncbi:MAG: alpha/beta hydrolase [Arenicellales bacterium]